MDTKTDVHPYCAHALPLQWWPPLGGLVIDFHSNFAVVIWTSRRHCILCWSNPEAKLTCVICRVMRCIYINSRDLLQQLCRRWTNTHRSLRAQAKRPMDISWLLRKLPAPRGIYIPRLLSIIRHLSFFPHSFTRLPVPTARKSWLVSQRLGRERSRWRYGEGQV